MKWVLSGIVLVLAVFWAGAVHAQDAKGPRIEVKDLNFDAGKVASGTTVEHIFEVRNTGNEPLIIDRVVPS